VSDAAAAIRRRLAPYARGVQAAAAVLGLAALLGALAGLPFDAGAPVPASTRRFLAWWCVGVPYWFYLEYTFLLDRDERGRPSEHALHLQRLSWTVWLGGAVALAAFVASGP
jgi:hypothetical protein